LEKHARRIPWEQFKENFTQNFSDNEEGSPPICDRMPLAALIIKEAVGK
jgi:hypothetical protein